MKFPIFIFHELVILLDQAKLGIRCYQSHTLQDEAFVLTTEKGSLIIPAHFLEMQFRDPNVINETDIAILAHNFRDMNY